MMSVKTPIYQERLPISPSSDSSWTYWLFELLFIVERFSVENSTSKTVFSDTNILRSRVLPMDSDYESLSNETECI